VSEQAIQHDHLLVLRLAHTMDTPVDVSCRGLKKESGPMLQVAASDWHACHEAMTEWQVCPAAACSQGFFATLEGAGLIFKGSGVGAVF
jgi:hypothetical protein